MRRLEVAAMGACLINDLIYTDHGPEVLQAWSIKHCEFVQ